MSVYARYSALLDGVLDQLVADGSLPADLDRKNVAVEPPRDAAHGDLATNVAMVLAKTAGTNPRALAGLVALAGHALTRPGAPGQFLVMTRPGLHRAQVLDLVHAAGGGVIAFGALPGLSVVLSGDDGFEDRVRQRGAWLVLPAPGSLGCVASDAEGAR